MSSFIECFLSPRTIICQSSSSLLMLHNLLVSYLVRRFTTPSTIIGVSVSSQIVLGNMLCFGLLSLTKCLFRSLWIVSICTSTFFLCVLKHFILSRRRGIQTYLFQCGWFRSINVYFSAAYCAATYETFCVIPNAHGCWHYDVRVILSEQRVRSPAASCAAASARPLCLLFSVTWKGWDKSHVTQLPGRP